MRQMANSGKSLRNGAGKRDAYREADGDEISNFGLRTLTGGNNLVLEAPLHDSISIIWCECGDNWLIFLPVTFATGICSVTLTPVSGNWSGDCQILLFVCTPNICRSVG